MQRLSSGLSLFWGLESDDCVQQAFSFVRVLRAGVVARLKRAIECFKIINRFTQKKAKRVGRGEEIPGARQFSQLGINLETNDRGVGNIVAFRDVTAFKLSHFFKWCAVRSRVVTGVVLT